LRKCGCFGTVCASVLKRGDSTGKRGGLEAGESFARQGGEEKCGKKNLAQLKAAGKIRRIGGR